MNDFMNIHFDLFGKRSAPAAEPPEEDLLAGFTPEERGGLLRVKSAVSLGQYSETTEESRRLMFARWLVEHDRLHD